MMSLSFTSTCPVHALVAPAMDSDGVTSVFPPPWLSSSFVPASTLTDDDVVSDDPSTSVPDPTLVAPVYELAPLRTSVPPPLLVSAPEPDTAPGTVSVVPVV